LILKFENEVLYLAVALLPGIVASHSCTASNNSKVKAGAHFLIFAFYFSHTKNFFL